MTLVLIFSFVFLFLALISRMLISLAFVPPLHVYESFRELEVYLMREEPSLYPVIKWFSYVFLNPINTSENVYHGCLCFKGIDHPTMGRFLGEMKKAQKLVDWSYEQCIKGEPAPKKRRAYQKADERILALVELYEQRNVLEYLRGLAHNFIMDQ